jgi:SPP1 gp7 family putative phage head morphogenesis protein
MGWAVTADVEEFDEAVDWFRARVPVTDEEYEALTTEQRSLAFHLASVNELAVVRTVFNEIEAAIRAGTPLEEFKKSVREKVTDAHARDGYYLETVFRNATQDAYNAGRWTQLTDPDVTVSRPYWMFDAVLDSRTTPICNALDATIKGHDDPFWLTHYPPLHHRCRSSIRSLRPSEARKRGLTVGDPDVTPGEGFGLAPPKRTDYPMPDREGVDADAYAVFEHRRAVDPDNTNSGEG